MKIAMIGHKKVPSREGGVEIAVEALAVRMAARGHDVTLYNRGGKTLPENKLYKGVHIRSVPVIQKRGISAVMGSFFATVCALFGHYDVVHLHAEGIAAMAFLPHLLGIRTIVTIHGLDWRRSKWGRFASWYLKLGEKIAVACADQIIVLSRAAQQYFLETYQRETVYIPNGIERAAKREACAITEKWGLHQDEYILYLGRIVPEKGIHYLIDSFRQTRTNKKLVIVGSPLDMEKYYEQLCQAAAGDDRILFTGFLQGQELEELYSNCYLYCLPSELEGMPISLLEALSFGNCCLCSDIAECAEILCEHGFYFSSGNAADLQRVLQMLCDRPELVSQCRQRVIEDFSHRTWDEITEETLELYRKET